MFRYIIGVALMIISNLTMGESLPSIRIGSIVSGTMSWELQAIKNRGLDRANGISIDQITLANPDAGRVGLLSRNLDIIVSDWIWVAKERLSGHPLVFSPYSTAFGRLVAPGMSTIQKVRDLKGKRLGVAGGPLDKNWLLLKTVALKVDNIDLEKETIVSFGAPPLLNEMLAQGRLDALLTYWNHAANLESRGFQIIMSGHDLEKLLGIQGDMPALGYVFDENWAKANPHLVAGFLKAANEARSALCESDDMWNQVKSLTNQTGQKAQENLRKRYCESLVTGLTQQNLIAAREIYRIIIQSVDTGSANGLKEFPESIFWNAPRSNN